MPAPIVRRVAVAAATIGAAVSAACAPAKPGAVAPRTAADTSAAGLPPVPEVRGPLALRVVYPAPGAVVSVRDSSFLFGSAGTGAAHLTINGQPVRVWPNGAWLAWLRFPPDSVMRFHIQASTGTDSATLDYDVRRAAGDRDSIALFPQGRIWWPADEYLPLVARAPAGARVQVRLPGGIVVPLAAQSDFGALPDAMRAFDLDSEPATAAVRVERYVGVLRGRAVGRDPGPLLGAAPTDTASATRSGADTMRPMLEVIRGTDTTRALWPVRLAMLDTMPTAVTFDDDTARRGNTDSITVGRATPRGTYHWFFPTGTRALVTGRVNDDVRVRLSPGATAWIAAAEAIALPRGAAIGSATVSSLTMRSAPDRVVLRVPVSARVPTQVTEGDRTVVLTLYGAVGDVNWIRYGPGSADDSLVRRIAWAQAGPDVTVTIDLAAPVWGFRTRWDRNDLLLEIRRPPALDATNPLRGRHIVVDAGHPPAGATGPTGLREADANLAVALRLRELLQAAGAEVLMTRTADTAVDLWPRVKFAEAANADLLISIHNNALPDGLNPFTSSGTSVFYNHPRSIPLARAIQHHLLRSLGLRDLGIGRGDLALARSTWMPSVLCEGLFMTVPEQEAALRQPEGQARYANAVFEGVRSFLRQGSDREREP